MTVGRGLSEKTLGLNFQDFFGDDNNPNGFKMFSSSEFQKQDLIFKDSTVEIVPVGERRTFESWLGQPFLDSLEGLESSQCSRAGETFVLWDSPPPAPFPVNKEKEIL